MIISFRGGFAPKFYNIGFTNTTYPNFLLNAQIRGFQSHIPINFDNFINHCMKRISLLTVVFLSFTIVAIAQPTKKILADKIIGVVGDKVILQSDLQNALLDMQRQGIEAPPNASCLTLEQMLSMKALILQAEKDSLPVSEDEIDGTIDTRIRYFISQYGSREELERIYGRSVFQLKEDMRSAFREQKLAENMRNKIVDGVKITPNEVKAYWEKIPTDSLPFYESEVEIGQIIIFPKAGKEAEDYAKDQLLSYKQQIEAGKDFATVAKLNTDDPGTKQAGGRIDINRNQKDLDPIWLAKAFTLKEGQISNPFRTRFGFHIIQLVSRVGDDAVVRHILKIPMITSVETGQAKSKLDTVRANLISGIIDFGTAVNKYSNDEISKYTAGMLSGPNGTYLTIDQLDKDMIPILSTLKVGEYSQPLDFKDERDRKGVRIVYLKSKSQPHRENLKDDYSRIATRALEEKKMQVLEDWLAKKISSYYVQLDEQFKDCPTLEKWYDAAKASKTRTFNK